MRAREAALWEMEERHIHEKQQLVKKQLKDIFFLQRHQVTIELSVLFFYCSCSKPLLDHFKDLLSNKSSRLLILPIRLCYFCT